MSDTPIAAALKTIDELPPDQLRAGLIVDEKHVAAAVDVSKGLGQHWTVGAHAEYGRAWHQHAGWMVAAGATRKL